MATGRAAEWWTWHRFGAAYVAVLTVAFAFATASPAPAQTHVASQGPGGPILVVAAPEDGYYAEILRAEGLNEFTMGQPASLTAQSLAAYQVVIVSGGSTLSDAQVAALTQWVKAGGNLVAMRPGPTLAPLVGLGADEGDLREGYMKIDTTRAPGAGLTDATMQFHGTADRRAATNATTVATLYADASTPTASAAVTMRSVGNAGGQAAAFTYDLARSVVQTRQGNPAWIGWKRDWSTQSIRSVDLFYGAAAYDMQPDWVNRDKVAIPQADEQQRLLANLVTAMTLDRAPLPRFWYLPRGERATVVMTGDDHDTGNTLKQFQTFAAASAPGCSVDDWECVRSTSYLTTGTPITNEQARAAEAQGFEIALHLNMNCKDFTPASLEAAWQAQKAQFEAAWNVSALRTLRTHCVTWSDWASEPKAELRHGVRFDTNYYYANGNWVQNRPGMFTGSGFPMRFADVDGSIVDVYQATTQMTDESGMDYPKHIAALLDGALGPSGYFGVFTVNMHTDFPTHAGADAVLAAAQARHVPIVSSVQMLTWLDGRNGSSFRDFSVDGGRVQFEIARAAGSRGLEAMVPARSAYGSLLELTADGAPVSTTSRTVKGIEYAVFPATAATYVASYPTPPPAPPAPPEEPAPEEPAPQEPAPVAPAQAAPAPAPQSPSGTGQAPPTTTPATGRGKVRFRVTCRLKSRPCRITVRLRHAGKVIARGKAGVPAGKSGQVAVRVPRPIQKKLAQRGSLRMTAVITGERGGKKPPTTRGLRLRSDG